MADIDIARQLALNLPEATEEPYHHMTSFRVRGKVFVTVPDEEHLHLMLSEEQIRAAVARKPASCEEKWWGKKLAALRVSLPHVGEDLLLSLLTDARRRRAPADAADPP